MKSKELSYSDKLFYKNQFEEEYKKYMQLYNDETNKEEKDWLKVQLIALKDLIRNMNRQIRPKKKSWEKRK